MGNFVPGFVSAVLALSLAGIAPGFSQEVGNQADLPLVWVLSTGGTIAGTGASDFKELLQTSSANRSVRCAGVTRAGRIS